MKKSAFLILRGLAIGLMAGLFLSAMTLALYRTTHDLPDPARVAYVNRYFLTAGALLGLLGGWVAGLQAVLSSILDPVLWKLAGFLPAVTGHIDEDWVRRLSGIMDRVLTQTGPLLRNLIGLIFMPRLRKGWDGYQRAVEKTRRKDPPRFSTPQGLSYAALGYFLRPLWVFFYFAYGVLAVCFGLFLGIPFIP